jgi:hypothetical protein
MSVSDLLKEAVAIVNPINWIIKGGKMVVSGVKDVIDGCKEDTE